MNLLFLRSYHVCNELGSFSTDGCPKQRLLLILLSDRLKLFLFLKGNDFFSTANAETLLNNLHGKSPLRTVNCLSLAIFLFLVTQYWLIWAKGKCCFVLKMCILSQIQAFHATVASQLLTFITVMWVTASTTRELIRARDSGHNQIDVQMVIGNSTIIKSAQPCNAF